MDSYPIKIILFVDSELDKEKYSSGIRFFFIPGKFCGDTKVPDVLISSKYRMLVTYRTSANHNVHKGFKAHYEGK